VAREMRTRRAQSQSRSSSSPCPGRWQRAFLFEFQNAQPALVLLAQAGTSGSRYFPGRESGRIGGYIVVTLESAYKVTKLPDVFARVFNVSDKKYATTGFLTNNSFNPNGTFRFDPDDWTNANAVSPAQPRAVRAGVRLQWK
jgi:hypothetical protein